MVVVVLFHFLFVLSVFLLVMLVLDVLVIATALRQLVKWLAESYLIALHLVLVVHYPILCVRDGGHGDDGRPAGPGDGRVSAGHVGKGDSTVTTLGYLWSVAVPHFCVAHSDSWWVGREFVRLSSVVYYGRVVNIWGASGVVATEGQAHWNSGLA